MMVKQKGYRRGYPVAVLVGFEDEQVTLWRIYSQVAKLDQTILLEDRKSQKVLYNFHESIVNALRPILKEGVKSTILASPPRTSYAQDFLRHIKDHQAWLLQGANKATFSTITGSAITPSQVAELTKTANFKQLIEQTTTQETENILETLEKSLSKTDNLVFYSLEEAENLIFSNPIHGKPAPEYLLLTNTYLQGNRQKNRIHRLMQIAQNKNVKTRVVNAESAAGARLNQLGGLVCLAKLA